MNNLYIETWWKVTYTNSFAEGGVSGSKQWGGRYEEVLILFYLIL